MKKLVKAMLVCGMITSMTAAVQADEPTVISPAPNAEDVLVGQQQIRVDGENADLSKLDLSTYIYSKNDNVMVPLRAVAEKMGCSVAWDAEKQAVTVGDDEWEIVLNIGDDSYYGVTKIKDAVGMTAPQTYGVSPEIVEDRTFVPAKMFELMGYTYNSVGQYVDFEKAGGQTQIPNPFTEYETIDEALKAVNFNALYPANAPEGYEVSDIFVMSGEMLQIVYKNADNEIIYRTQKGTEDISGDCNTFKSTQALKVGDITASVRTSDNGMSVIWTSNGLTYSVYSDKALTNESISFIISSVK